MSFVRVCIGLRLSGCCISFVLVAPMFFTGSGINLIDMLVFGLRPDGAVDLVAVRSDGWCDSSYHPVAA